MRGAAYIAIALLCGCDLVFDIRVPADAQGARLVIPPDGVTVCQPPPPFEEFAFADAPLPAISGALDTAVSHVTFYSAADGVRVIQLPFSEDGLWEGRLGDAAAQQVTGAGGTGKVIGIGALPDGQALWYFDGGTNNAFVAVPAGPTTWAAQRTDLGFPDAFLAVPSGPAYHDGTVRMIIDVHDTINTRRHVEASTTDGVRWTALDTFQLAVDVNSIFDAALSPDGCFLLFVHFISNTREVCVAARDTDGRFTTFVPIGSATQAAPGNALSPVVTPGLDAMYVMDGQLKRVLRGARP